MKPYSEWTNDELWRHEQRNFAAHMAIMFTYLQKHIFSVDDFVRYTADQVIGGWKEVKTVADMMNATLVNIRANGGEVLEALFEGDHPANAIVTWLLKEEIMARLAYPVEVTSKFWDKFTPIAAALGMRFEYKRIAEKRFQILVERQT